MRLRLDWPTAALAVLAIAYFYLNQNEWMNYGRSWVPLLQFLRSSWRLIARVAFFVGGTAACIFVSVNRKYFFKEAPLPEPDRGTMLEARLKQLHESGALDEMLQLAEEKKRKSRPPPPEAPAVARDPPTVLSAKAATGRDSNTAPLTNKPDLKSSPGGAGESGKSPAVVKDPPHVLSAKAAAERESTNKPVVPAPVVKAVVREPSNVLSAEAVEEPKVTDIPVIPPLVVEDEPAEGAEAVVVRVRLPSGSHITRRFAPASLTSAVTAWVSSLDQATLSRPEKWALARSYPRAILDPESTVAAASEDHMQLVLFLEEQ